MASGVPRVIGDNPETRRFLDKLDRAVLGLQNPAVTPVAPLDASYVTLGTNATLSAERVLTAGTGISLADGGAGSTLTVAVTSLGGLTNLSYAGAVGAGATYSVTGLGGYKMLLVNLREVSHNSGSNQSFRCAVSGNGGSSYGTALSPNGSQVYGAAVGLCGMFFVTNTDQTNNQTVTIGLFGGSPIDTSSRGPIDALQFSFSGGNFDNGSIDIYGLK